VPRGPHRHRRSLRCRLHCLRPLARLRLRLRSRLDLTQTRSGSPPPPPLPQRSRRSGSLPLPHRRQLARCTHPHFRLQLDGHRVRLPAWCVVSRDQ
jgi:hypothetical protein